MAENSVYPVLLQYIGNTVLYNNFKWRYFMKTAIFKRIACMFLTMCFLCGAIPPEAVLNYVQAQTVEGGETIPIIYSQKGEFYFEQSAPTFYEKDGKGQLKIIRAGDSTKEMTVTLRFYDISAAYEDDYTVTYGEEMPKAENSKPVYYSFRDNGELVSIVTPNEATSNLPTEKDDAVSAAEMLNKISEIDAKSTEFDVEFESGQASAIIDINVVNDDISEYSEMFFVAVIDDDGFLFEDGVASVSLKSDEEEPVVHVEFESTKTLSVNEETGMAELAFTRKGNLATNTSAMLLYDGNPMGYVDFAPYQDKQVAYVLPGVYTLLAGDKYTVGDGAVTVQGQGRELPEGADAKLDALPDSYDALPQMVQASVNTNWFPDWAKSTSAQYIVDTENGADIYVGSTSGNLFAKRSSSTDGSVTWPYNNQNMYALDTEGGASTGFLYIDSLNRYDMAGIESIESRAYITDLRGKCDVKFGLKGLGEDKHYTGVNKDYVNLKYTLPEKTTGSYYIYYCNRDLDKLFNDGCIVYAPNAFKLNKRNYNINIVSPEPLKYNGEASSQAPIITSDLQFTNYRVGENKKINITYSTSGYYACRLVGYQFKGTGTSYSDVISLNGASTITFDSNFLKSYESAWAYKDENDTWSFEIRPVFEKIKVDYTIQPSSLGTIKIVSPESSDGRPDLYIGDVVVFEGDSPQEAELMNVLITPQTNMSNAIPDSGTKNASEGQVTFTIQNTEYSGYIFQGQFGYDPEQLYVNYIDEEAKMHGSFENQTSDGGLAIDTNEYVIGQYVPLVANANEDYVTVWISNGRYYYGDVYNYQLDGNPSNNIIYVDFIHKDEVKMVTTDLCGYLKRQIVVLNTSETTEVPLADTTFYINAHSGEAIECTTDANGYFEIKNFNGITAINESPAVKGKYSMSIAYQGEMCYEDIEYTGDGKDIIVKLPYFATGFYPTRITATTNGQGADSNNLEILKGATTEITVKMFRDPDIYTIKSVTFHLVTLTEDGGLKTEKDFSASLDTTANAGNNYEMWGVKITDSTKLLSGTRIYISVVADKTYTTVDAGGNKVQQKTEQKLEMIETIYTLVASNKPVPTERYDLPELDGATSSNNLSNEDRELLDLPVIGSVNFGFSSKTGGYFVQTVDSENPDYYTLCCGYSITPVYLEGTPKDKYDAAKKTKENLNTARAERQEQNGSSKVKGKSTTRLDFYPIFSISVKVNTVTGQIIAMDFALGIDAFIMYNVPFALGPVPVYICVNVNSEAYVQLKYVYKDKYLTDVKSLLTPSNDAEQMFICAPIMKVGLKGGVGYNGFLSVFAEGNLSFPLMIDCVEREVGGKVSFDVSIGADMVLFTGKITYSKNIVSYGDQKLLEQLETIEQKQTLKAMYSTSKGNYETLDEAFANMTFTIPDRSQEGLIKMASSQSDVLVSDVFKNTNVYLYKLDENRVMAFFLADNNAEDGSLNYLSAAYCVSEDGGNTWGPICLIDDNSSAVGTSLQYDINVYELEDNIIVTWSEADFDTLLKSVDVENISAQQVAKVLNAMNLRGRIFSKQTGKPVGEAFTIAENSAVACGALDAVQNGDNIYVYYQRNAYQTTENVTAEDIANTERTIAMAVADINDTQKWTSVPIRAENEEGGEYRIVEVQPFVHDGIFGEIVVLDRDGKLMTYDYQTESLQPSIEDREMYLRVYSVGGEGLPPKTEALIRITKSSDCAQTPEVLSTDNYLHLLWNNNGQIVYMTDFVARDTDHEEVRANAYVIANADGTYTVQTPEESGMVSVVSDESTFHIGSKFSASIAEDGNVLLCWIGNDAVSEEQLVPTDEIYGLLLKTMLNSDVVALREELEDLEGCPHTYQLYAEGEPIALTDVNMPIGALDSICMQSGVENKFLLAFTKLNNKLRLESDGADLMVQFSIDKPEISAKLEITKYPLPGSVATAIVTLQNEGLETFNGANIRLSGIGEDIVVKYEKPIFAGASVELPIDLPIPESFNATTNVTLDVAGLEEQAQYTSQATAEVLYESYFVFADLPELHALSNSNDCIVILDVKNIGNAPGTPTVKYLNRPYISNQGEGRDYQHTFDESVSAGGETKLQYILEDPLMEKDVYSIVQISLGDGYDQMREASMPKPIMAKAVSDQPEDGGEENVPPTGENMFVPYVALIAICSLAGVVYFKKRRFN